eukprot:scaffold1310_cov128-Skeletonema_dohrnii-CCMP3373.AAC.1
MRGTVNEVFETYVRLRETPSILSCFALGCHFLTLEASIKATMPTAIEPTAPTAPGVKESSATIINVLDALKAKDAIDKSSAMKSALNLKDLPQDARSPFSPTVDETPRDGNANYNAQGSPAVAGNIHAWVSPNKSDEVPSSKESSPDVSNQTSLPSSKESSPESFNLNITAISNANKENVDNSFSNVNVNDGASPIAIVGRRLVDSKKPDVPPLGLADVSSSNAMTDALVFDASNKDWIKIVHGGKE